MDGGVGVKEGVGDRDPAVGIEALPPHHDHQLRPLVFAALTQTNLGLEVVGTRHRNRRKAE